MVFEMGGKQTQLVCRICAHKLRMALVKKVISDVCGLPAPCFMSKTKRLLARRKGTIKKEAEFQRVRTRAETLGKVRDTNSVS